MTCEGYLELASDSLDGQLEAAEERLLNAHLVLCADCSDRQDELLALGGLLASLGPVEPPPTQALALVRAVEHDERGILGFLRRLLGCLTPLGGLVPSTTVAAAALLVVLGVVWPDQRPLDPPRPPATAGLTSDIPNDTLLTVWDSSADVIVASAAPIDIDELELLSSSLMASANRATPAVRMFLYERIVVFG